MTADLDRYAAQRPVQAPGRVGQATAVEQSRAVAQVHAQALIAQQCPRDEDRAVAAMRRACMSLPLAERAFYEYKRGGSPVVGPSIHLARELARIWGNIESGIAELRRDDEYGQSEMHAFSWDLETNARVTNTFIVPHVRDKRGGGGRLVETRDIYENNANAGARRLREAIFDTLPVDFVEQAKTLCRETLERGNGETIEQRRAKAVGSFQGIGVTVEQLATRFGPVDRWTPQDVAQLGILFTSLRRNEITVEEAFPAAAPVTVAEIKGKPAPAAEPAHDPNASQGWGPEPGTEQ
jgi:hypothetical protein